ncbi:MAG: HEAT repeat domain-containing protein [Planctomycetota bacterium]
MSSQRNLLDSSYRWGIAFGIALALATPLCAGTVSLSSGGGLAGRVRKVDDAKSPYVIVNIDQDLSVAIAGVHVRRVIGSDDLAEYRQRAAQAEQSGEAVQHYELSRWCKQNSLLHQRRYHLNRAIMIDADHERARAALGFVRDKRGQWILFALLRRSQGLVQDRRGRWVLPEMVEAERLAKSNDVTSSRWHRTLASLGKRATRGDAEAIAELTAITDPLAAEAIAKELAKTRGQTKIRSVRMTYVKLLASFRTTESVKALTETGLVEADAVVREEALEQLQDYGSSSAVASYLPLLQANQPQVVKTAARALSYFPSEELAMKYVDALVTVQTTREQIGSGGTDVGFTNNGSAGLSQGAKIVERKTPVQHPEILQILRTIEPDANFGYDESRWRRYFAAKRSPSVGDLRRDP